MTVSVVVTTYNGERFILAQLASILNQTVKADQVIVSDDCSTDHTIQIISAFIREKQLKNWLLIPRSKNLGWKRNFIETMKVADGEIILLSDQDDIWEPDKIESYRSAFSGQDKAFVIASNYSLFFEKKDATQQKLDRQTDSMINNGKTVRWQITEQFHIIDRPGCVFGVRKTFFQSIVEAYPEDFPHDSFLWLAAASLGGLYILQKLLIKYRRHDSNAIRKKTLSNVSRKERIKYIENELHTVTESGKMEEKSQLSTHEREIVERFKKLCKTRLKLLNDRNIFAWLVLFLKYKKYYSSSRSIVADLMITMKGC